MEEHIGGGKHYYPYPVFDHKFFYNPEESLPKYPLKIYDVKLIIESPKYTNGISRCPFTISDIEVPIIGFS